MRASNRYQVDMLETGYYYLNAPVGNVKLGTANVDVQQMPCIVKVDNVGTSDSAYRLTLSEKRGFYGEYGLENLTFTNYRLGSKDEGREIQQSNHYIIDYVDITSIAGMNLQIYVKGGET